jgi:hypothetical protein
LFDTGLFQNPSLNACVPHPEQVQRPAAVMFLGDGTWFVALDLSDDTGRGFNPFRQSSK